MLFRKDDRKNFGETLWINMTCEFVVVANLTQNRPFTPSFKVVSELPHQRQRAQKLN